MWYQFRPYVPVAVRRAKAARELEKRKKKGDTVSPVVITGRTIAQTFWGKAWCENLESYSDFANRLPRGRTYVRNGSVVDLKILPGKIEALVSGSSLYRVTITITPLADNHWGTIKSSCAGQIGSLVELLQGRLSTGVMEIVTARDGGLFPKPAQIKLSCSCPDWAGMCKHVAAVLYGVGARLDHQPELLFHLRQVDHLELIAQAVPSAGTRKAASGKKTLAAADVAGVFGIEIAAPDVAESESSAESPAKRKKRAVRAIAEQIVTPRKSAKSSRKQVATLPTPEAVTAPRARHARKVK